MASSREKLLAASKRNYEEQKQTSEQPTLVTGVVNQLNTMEEKTPLVLDTQPVPKEEPSLTPKSTLTTSKATMEKEILPEPSQKQVERSDLKTKSSPVVLFEKKVKENRSVRKCFLITPSINNELVGMAKRLGVSENDLINNILKQVFDI